MSNGARQLTVGQSLTLTMIHMHTASVNNSGKCPSKHVLKARIMEDKTASWLTWLNMDKHDHGVPLIANRMTLLLEYNSKQFILPMPNKTSIHQCSNYFDLISFMMDSATPR